MKSQYLNGKNVALAALLLPEAISAFSFDSWNSLLGRRSTEPKALALDKSKLPRFHARNPKIIRRQDDSGDDPSNTGTPVTTTATATDAPFPTSFGGDDPVETDLPEPTGSDLTPQPSALPADTQLVQIYLDIDDTIYVQAGQDGNLYLTVLDTASNTTDQDSVPTGTTDSSAATSTGAADTDDDGSDDGGLDTSTFFQADSNGIVTGDYNGRLLHLYQGEMDTYNVSRIRMHDENSLPVSSVLVTLYPITNPASPAGVTLGAVTTNGVVYYLAACSFQEILTKVFLIEDESGLDILQDPAMKTVLTGGTVESCLMLGFTNGQAGLIEMP